MLDGRLGKAQYYTLCIEFQERSKLKMVKKQGQYPNESGSEEGQTNKILTLSRFLQQKLPDDETKKGINSLNSKQREVFHVVPRLCKI